MKRFWLIWVLLIVALVGCQRPTPAAVETCHGASLQPELATIDTLMQTRPDSALTLLLDSTFNDPYYQLLLSEALYKNDYSQTNRKELLDAMAYYDSLCGRDAARHVSTEDVFLMARCHYMNGVGYYEMDSVVPACAEYMKALEIMEEHFEEKNLVGYKAKFMALAYTHLYVLFSDKNLHQQAIYFAENSLPYYNRYDAEPWHVAWVLNNIGSRYHIMSEWDSAAFYYEKVVEILPDTNHLTFRDNVTLRAFLSYHKDKKPQTALNHLYRILNQVDNKQEHLSRLFIIGDILFHENNYDSALIILDTVFHESLDENCKRQSAEYLIEICKNQGKNSEEYANYLVPFANKEENYQSAVKTQLAEYYDLFRLKTKDKLSQNVIKENKTRTIIIIVGLLLIILILIFLFHNKKNKVKVLVDQITEKESKNKKTDNFRLFLEEAICQEILQSLQGNNIKRSTLPSDYPELILNDKQLQLLSLAVNRYFDSFVIQLEQYQVTSNPNLVNLCHLYLLGLNEKQISILLNKDYSTIKRYENRLSKIFKTNEKLVSFVRKMAIN